MLNIGRQDHGTISTRSESSSVCEKSVTHCWRSRSKTWTCRLFTDHEFLLRDMRERVIFNHEHLHFWFLLRMLTMEIKIRNYLRLLFLYINSTSNSIQIYLITNSYVDITSSLIMYYLTNDYFFLKLIEI